MENNRSQRSSRTYSFLDIKITLSCITICCPVDVQFQLKRSTIQGGSPLSCSDSCPEFTHCPLWQFNV